MRFSDDPGSSVWGEEDVQRQVRRDLSSLLPPVPDDEEDEDEEPACETCGGSGEVPPVRLRYNKRLRYVDYGAPAHEWETCPTCDGSGVQEGR